MIGESERSDEVGHQMVIAQEDQRQSDGPSAAGKALALLEVLGDAERGLRLSEIARRAELAKSTAHRLLAILVSHRMVVAVNGSYMLGDRILDWAAPTSGRDAVSLKAITMPYLLDLYNMSQGTVYLGVLGGGGGIVTYLINLFGHESVATPSRARGWAPADCTAIGKILLSDRVQPSVTMSGRMARELAVVRRVGVAHSRGEYVPGVACVAVGVTDSTGRVCAAIAVGDRVDRLNTKRVIHQLRRAGLASSVAVQKSWRLGSLVT